MDQEMLAGECVNKTLEDHQWMPNIISIAIELCEVLIALLVDVDSNTESSDHHIKAGEIPAKQSA